MWCEFIDVPNLPSPVTFATGGLPIISNNTLSSPSPNTPPRLPTPHPVSQHPTPSPNTPPRLPTPHPVSQHPTPSPNTPPRLPVLCSTTGGVATGGSTYIMAEHKNNTARDWLRDLTETQRNCCITEKAMTLVARELADIVHIGKVMGFSQARIQHYQSNRPLSVSNQISHMFFDWRAK
ncbi:hypothetical protein NP493_154g04004 [Ridgeia piscesae]|uniref:Uncharacterized protein n=1 Tax=Ridgeia piscesae TaxID=27915 RepID=A0AAD9P445_RIDPI|nr:hypothetical protein NP493_154g04004 [Ridgeia piscesae]